MVAVAHEPSGRRLVRRTAMAHAALLTVVWGYLAVRGFLNFHPGHDFLAYHLPFALMRFGRTTFKPLPGLLAVYEGFPPLADWVQGGLILLTGTLSVSCGIGVVGLAIALVGMKVVHRTDVSLRWYLTALAAVPLVVIHTNVGYIDLWVGAAVLLAFAALARILAGHPEPRALACFWLGLTIAMLSKFTAWPFCFLLAAAFMASLAYRAAARTVTRRELVLYGALTVVIVTAFPLRNLLTLGNPTYPYQPTGLWQFSGFVGTGDEVFWKTNMPAHLRERSRPWAFVESAFELTRWRTAEPLRWNETQFFYRPTPHFRMGGWFVGTVAGMCVFLVAAGIYDRERRLALGVFLSMIAVLLGLTQNHELRYWPLIPMSGLFLVVTALPSMPGWLAATAKAYLLLAAAYVLSQTVPPPARFARAEDFITPAAKQYWATHEPRAPGSSWECIGQPRNAVFWAGPTLSEYRVQACRPWTGRECDGPNPPSPCARRPPIPPAAGAPGVDDLS
jgi:hypothetical protein